MLVSQSTLLTRPEESEQVPERELHQVDEFCVEYVRLDLIHAENIELNRRLPCGTEIEDADRGSDKETRKWISLAFVVGNKGRLVKIQS